MSIFNKKLFSKDKSDKAEALFYEVVLPDFFYHESVLRHQAIRMPRFSKDNPATLGFLIKALFPECEGKIKDAINLSVAMFPNEHTLTTIIDDAADVERIRPVDLTFSDVTNGERLPIKGLNNAFLVRFSDGAPIREVVFHFRGVFYQMLTPYVRVSVMIPPMNKEESLASGVSGAVSNLTGDDCSADQLSFLIVEDWADNSRELSMYESAERDLLTKLKKGEELTDLDYSIITGFNEFGSLWSYISYGKSLSEQERWFDAYRKFIRAWHIAHRELKDTPEKNHHWFYELAFEIGKCLSHLDRYDEAASFLSIASGYVKEAEIELNKVYACLSDIRANKSLADTMDGLDEELRKATGACSESRILTVGVMLTELFGAMPGSLRAMALRCDDETDGIVVTDPLAVWNTHVSALLKDRTTALVMYSPAGYITGNDSDKSALCDNGTFVIRVHKAATGKEDGLMRMSIMLTAFNSDSEKMYYCEENIPEGVSIIVGADEQQFQENDELRLIKSCNALGQSGRLLECSLDAKCIFKRLLSRWKELDEDEKQAFFDSAYQVGYCYMDFRLFEKAKYYLEIAAYSQYVNYMQEYLNCLSNSFDPRVIPVIDYYLSLKMADGIDSATIHNWKCFLYRRKAYNLIEVKNYNEAKEVLHQLLNDPDPLNQTYAKNELDYLNGLMRENN